MKKWYLLWVMLFGLQAFSQTGVVITYYDNTQQQFNVQTTGKLYFSGDDLQIQIDDTVTQPTSIPVTIIQRITFTNNLNTANYTPEGIQLTLFPNPGAEYIQINTSTTDVLNVKIFNTNGQIVHSGEYFPMQTIAVAELAAGLYIVQANGFTSKFLKK
jgi:hypothetical protein